MERQRELERLNYRFTFFFPRIWARRVTIRNSAAVARSKTRKLEKVNETTRGSIDTPLRHRAVLPFFFFHISRRKYLSLSLSALAASRETRLINLLFPPDEKRRAALQNSLCALGSDGAKLLERAWRDPRTHFSFPRYLFHSLSLSLSPSILPEVPRAPLSRVHTSTYRLLFFPFSLTLCRAQSYETRSLARNFNSLFQPLLLSLRVHLYLRFTSLSLSLFHFKQS